MYQELLVLWVYISIPFVISNFITCYQLLVKGNLLLGVTVKRKTDRLQQAYTEFNNSCNGIPWWIVSLLATTVIVMLSVLDGLLWVIKPYKQLKKMYNVALWNFIKI